MDYKKKQKKFKKKIKNLGTMFWNSKENETYKKPIKKEGNK